MSKSIYGLASTLSLTALLALTVISPSFALADSTLTASSTTISSDSNEWYQRGSGRMRYYYDSNGIGQKISALPSVATQAIFIPVLFGVSVKNLFPNFGDPRDGGSRTHKGEDIMAAKGTPIVSPTDAVVLRTGTGSSEGNYVYTANPGGETFVYMHLDRIGEGVTSGTVLAQGSLIGYVGNTGNASGGAAHLHFEVRNSSGTHIDPFPRLTAEFTAEQKNSYLSNILAVTTNPSVLSQFTTAKVTASVAGLTRDLKQGMSGQDVLALQKKLNANGYTVATSGAGSVGNETTYFGPATQAAVIKFQSANNVAPAVGYVGPLTRNALTLVA